MYFNIVKFGINLLVTILLVPLSLISLFLHVYAAGSGEGKQQKTTPGYS